MARHDTATVECALALTQRGAVPDAFRLLTGAVERGDALAAAQLADWRLAGDLIRRDLAEARTLYGRAAELGYDEVAPVHIAMLASGAGGSGRDWRRALDLLAARARNNLLAGRQCKLLDAMRLDADGDPLSPQVTAVIYPRPRIESLPGFLTTAECGYLISLANLRLEPALVIHPQSGHLIQDPVRRAQSAAFPFVVEDPVIHAINRRIAAATGTSYDRGEPVQVLAYDTGDEYKLHSDALDHDANQRVTTLLVALTGDYQGGETDFPRIGIRWRGKPGDALRFDGVTPYGLPDQLAWHAGLPVTRGRKLILSKWIRARPLDLSGPSGRPF